MASRQIMRNSDIFTGQRTSIIIVDTNHTKTPRDLRGTTSNTSIGTVVKDQPQTFCARECAGDGCSYHAAASSCRRETWTLSHNLLLRISCFPKFIRYGRLDTRTTDAAIVTTACMGAGTDTGMDMDTATDIALR